MSQCFYSGFPQSQRLVTVLYPVEQVHTALSGISHSVAAHVAFQAPNKQEEAKSLSAAE